MTNENVNATESAPVAEVKKVNRRGISSARGTTRLKFSHIDANRNGLFIGHLDNVAVSMIKIGEDKTGMPSFNGLEIPKLTLTFASNEDDVAKRKYVNLTFTAVESNTETIPGGTSEWKVNSVFDWLKHILNVYVLKGREMTEEEAVALCLPFEDFDEQGEYVSVEPEVVISGWKELFNNFAAILNEGNNGKPYYKTKDNKIIPVWFKIIRYIKNNKKGWQAVNNGDLAFPSFVGEGCIEVFKQNTIPSIKLDAIKEAIIPMNVSKPKTPNMPNNPVASPIMGGVPVDNMMNSMPNSPFNNDIALEAEGDMPF